MALIQIFNINFVAISVLCNGTVYTYFKLAYRISLTMASIWNSRPALPCSLKKSSKKTPLAFWSVVLESEVNQLSLLHMSITNIPVITDLPSKHLIAQQAFHQWRFYWFFLSPILQIGLGSVNKPPDLLKH